MLHQDPTPAFEPSLLETPLPVGYGVVFSSASPDEEDEEEYLCYEVQSGDTLSAIAEEELGDASRWKEIHELNKETITDPNEIQPGQMLFMPEDWDAEEA